MILCGCHCVPMLEVMLTNTEVVRAIYLDLDLIFLLFLLSLLIRFFLHLALMLLDSGINT